MDHDKQGHRTNRRYKAALWALGVVVVLFFPFSTGVVPAWTVYIVDTSHEPLRGITARETWQDHNVETESHEASAFSNDAGKVVFPTRSIRASIAERTIGFANNLWNADHAFWGNTAQVYVWEPCYKTERSQFRETRMRADTIVLQRVETVSEPCCSPPRA